MPMKKAGKARLATTYIVIQFSSFVKAAPLGSELDNFSAFAIIQQADTFGAGWNSRPAVQPANRPPTDQEDGRSGEGGNAAHSGADGESPDGRRCVQPPECSGPDAFRQARVFWPYRARRPRGSPFGAFCFRRALCPAGFGLRGFSFGSTGQEIG